MQVRSTRWSPERAHSRLCSFSAMEVSNPYSEYPPPTIDRRSQPYATSILHESVRYMIQFHPANEWKNVSLFPCLHARKFYATQIRVFVLKAFPAAWMSTLHRMLWLVPVSSNMHPSCSAWFPVNSWYDQSIRRLRLPRCFGLGCKISEVPTRTWNPTAEWFSCSWLQILKCHLQFLNLQIKSINNTPTCSCIASNTHTHQVSLQKLTNEPKCEFHTTSSRTVSLHHPRFAYPQYECSFDGSRPHNGTDNTYILGSTRRTPTDGA